MNKYKQRLVICILCFLIFVSCAPLRNPTSMTPPTVHPTRTIASAIVQPMSTETVFENQEQVSDGKLKLSIKNLENKCYRPGNPIPIIITYENLTNEPLTIVDYKSISAQVLLGGLAQLFPVLTQEDGEQVLTPEQLARIETFNPTSPLLRDLLPKSSFDVPIEYYFPLEIATPDNHEQGKLHPTPSGVYFIKFVYMGFENNVAWTGSISSNQINICIKN